jgi:hypothetical protein
VVSSASPQEPDREVAMAFEQFRVQLAMLLDEIARNPADAHEMQETLREKLAEMQGLGLPLPDDLVGLERYLEADLDRAGARGRRIPEEPDQEA